MASEVEIYHVGDAPAIKVRVFSSVHFRNPSLPVNRIEWADGTHRLIAEFQTGRPDSFRITDRMPHQCEVDLKALAASYVPA